MNKISNEEKNNILKNLSKKWNYLDFVNNDYLNDKILEALQTINFNEEINREVSLLMETENIIYKDISTRIKSGDLDLEIVMLDKVKYLSTIVGKKMNLGISQKEKEKTGENGLIYALENYDGKESFAMYAARILKSFYKQENIQDRIDRFESYRKSLIENKELNKKTDTNSIDNIFRMNHLEEFIDQTNEDYCKFIILKYGYINDKNYNCKQISKILGLPSNKINRYYKNSLELLKQKVGINKNIEKIKTKKIKEDF